MSDKRWRALCAAIESQTGTRLTGEMIAGEIVDGCAVFPAHGLRMRLVTGFQVGSHGNPSLSDSERVGTERSAKNQSFESGNLSSPTP